MSLVWHMKCQNQNSGAPIPSKFPSKHHNVGPYLAKKDFVTPTSQMNINEAYGKGNYFYSTSTSTLEKFFEKTKRIHVKVQKIVQMFQILDLINFATFFHNWYFKGSDSTMDTNVRLKMLLHVGLNINLDMEKDNFLFETTTIFVVAYKVHNGVFLEA